MSQTTNNKPYKVTILTLYKEVFLSYLGAGVIGKALGKEWILEIIDIRDFAEDSYKRVDDKVFGGGKGLLLKPDVLGKAIDYALTKQSSTNLVYPSPRGVVFNAEMAQELAKEDGITLICGHFEGVDQRIIDEYKPKEISIGDYILSGGELASMVLLDSILRFLPNVLNSYECLTEESFKDNLLEYPQYTKPNIWKNHKVPEVLLSGNHARIREWRTKKAEEQTKKVRPDLWQKYKNLINGANND
ncbi:tRNA (guanine-N(1)-)-methyltransferase [Candidatus Hepatincola sp. Pdp]